MITILTEEKKINEINELILSRERMNELVRIINFTEPDQKVDGNSILVNNAGISLSVDWLNTRPPYVLPEFIWYTEDNLLAIIYFLLGNVNECTKLLESNPALACELKIISQLSQGHAVNPDNLSVETFNDFDDYRLMHNHAITNYYGSAVNNQDKDKIHYYFNNAIDSAVAEEYRSFSAKHYINFLFDQGELEHAEKVARDILNYDVSSDAKAEIENLLYQVYLKNLTAPYDQDILTKIKVTIWSVLQHYESKDRKVEAALVYQDASHIALISESYTEALGYITKAINIFEETDLKEFYFDAVYKKAVLLFTWAKNGNPQFFRPAMESYQEALKFFRKEEYPTIYADIQHHLGALFAEIPDDVKKKSIWAGVSSASFNEALSIYSKEKYPYEYALVCTGFGNALSKFPLAKHSDNFEKALFYYSEALDIRTSITYPVERSITLLNYIEASWLADNSQNESNQNRIEDMMNKCNEIISLNMDTTFIKAANEHKLKLSELQTILTAEAVN